MRWGIDFNVNKRKIIAFNNSDKVYPPIYKLNEKDIEQVTDSQYLGVTLQENLRFSKHIEAKITTAKKQLGMIKRALLATAESKAAGIQISVHAPSGVRSSSQGYKQQRGNNWSGSGAGSKLSCQVYSGTQRY